MDPYPWRRHGYGDAGRIMAMRGLTNNGRAKETPTVKTGEGYR